jgi:hypothetical protein
MRDPRRAKVPAGASLPLPGPIGDARVARGGSRRAGEMFAAPSCG